MGRDADSGTVDVACRQLALRGAACRGRSRDQSVKSRRDSERAGSARHRADAAGESRAIRAARFVAARRVGRAARSGQAVGDCCRCDGRAA